MTRFGLGFLVASALVMGACFSPPPGPDGRVPPDPLEGSNRAVFAFNDSLDRWFFEPLADGWAFVTPKVLRTSLGKFFKNLGYPGRLVTNLLQAEFRQAGSETLRFATNTTVGVAGFFDPASRFGLGQYDEDFGQVFGRWGFGSGPFWMIPVAGPSNPREAWGLLFDTAFDPLTYLFLVDVPGVGFVSGVNERSLADPQVELARDAAVDLYVSVRDAYIQRREALIRDGRVMEDTAPDQPADDLYEIPEDEDGIE